MQEPVHVSGLWVGSKIGVRGPWVKDLSSPTQVHRSVTETGISTSKVY